MDDFYHPWHGHRNPTSETTATAIQRTQSSSSPNSNSNNKILPTKKKINRILRLENLERYNQRLPKENM
jgi:hypothetical protein